MARRSLIAFLLAAGMALSSSTVGAEARSPSIDEVHAESGADLDDAAHELDCLDEARSHLESYHMSSDETGIPVNHTEMLWGDYVNKQNDPAIGWHSHDPVTGNARAKSKRPRDNR